MSRRAAANMRHLCRVRRRKGLLFPTFGMGSSMAGSGFSGLCNYHRSLTSNVGHTASMVVTNGIMMIYNCNSMNGNYSRSVHSCKTHMLMARMSPVYTLRTTVRNFRMMAVRSTYGRNGVFMAAANGVSVVHVSRVRRVGSRTVIYGVNRFSGRVRMRTLGRCPNVGYMGVGPRMSHCCFPSKRDVVLLTSNHLMGLKYTAKRPSFMVDGSFAGRALTRVRLFDGGCSVGMCHLPGRLSRRMTHLRLRGVKMGLAGLAPRRTTCVNMSMSKPCGTRRCHCWFFGLAVCSLQLGAL